MRARLILSLCLIILTAPALRSQAQDPLHDPNPEVRRRAVRQLAENGDRAAIPRLAALLQDADESVRADVVDAIAQLDTKEAVGPLTLAAKDVSARVRDRAIEGMVSLYVVPEEGGRFAILRRIADYFSKKSEDLVIDPGIEVDPRILEALSDELRDRDPDIRRKAARALGVLRARGASHQLAAMLPTPDPEFQLELLRALGKIRDPAVGGALAPLLESGDDRVAMLAAETLALSGARDQLPALRKLFERSPTRDVRRKALEAISMIPEPSLGQLFLEHLDDPDARLREVSADGLGRLARFDGAEASQYAARLEAHYGAERDRRVRLALAFGLLNYQRYNYLDDVMDALNSRLYNSYGIAYLTELGRKPEMLERYYSYLQSDKTRLRENLCEVFVRIGNPAAIDQLKPLMNDRSSDVAQAAIRAVTVLSRLAGRK